MTRPTRRRDSSFLQFRQRTPGALLAARRGQKITFHYPDGCGGEIARTVTIGPVIKVSFVTREPELAKLRTAILMEQVGRHTRAVTDGPKVLTQRQAVALAGDIYR